MPNKNIFQKAGRSIKDFGLSLKKEWHTFTAGKGRYAIEAFHSGYLKFNFWYNRTRKVITEFSARDWLNGFTAPFKEGSTNFIEFLIQIFNKEYVDGKLAKLVKTAAEELKKKKEGIEAEIKAKFPNKTPEELEKLANNEFNKYESAVNDKVRPLALVFKLVSGIFDFIDAVLLFIKTFKKLNEIEIRNEAQRIQKDLADLQDTLANLAPEERKARFRNEYLDDYKHSYEKLIRSTRDPILAQAFFEAYKITLREKFGLSIQEINQINLDLHDVTRKYDKAVTKIKNTKAIDFHDVNLKALENLQPQNAEPNTKFKRISNMVTLKNQAKVFEYTIAIIKNNPLFSGIKNDKEAQDELLFDKAITHRKYAERKRFFKERIIELSEQEEPLNEKEKALLNRLKKELEYLKHHNDKATRLCDLTQIDDLSNLHYKQYKWASLGISVILMLNAVFTLARFVMGVVSLATTGNPAPVLKSSTDVLEKVTDFVNGNAVTFVDVGASNILGLFRTWEKFRIVNKKFKALDEESRARLRALQERKERLVKAKKEYEDSKKALEKDPENATLREAYNTTRTNLRNAREGDEEGLESYSAIKDRAKQIFEENHRDLKAFQVAKSRHTHLKQKLIKKSVDASGGILMFGLSLLLFFIPAGVLTTIAALIIFVAIPVMRRFRTPEGQKEMRLDAQALGLLPLEEESTQNRSLLFWPYATLSFLLNIIDQPLKTIVVTIILKSIDWIIKKISPNSNGLKNVIDAINEYKIFSWGYWIARFIKWTADTIKDAINSPREIPGVEDLALDIDIDGGDAEELNQQVAGPRKYTSEWSENIKNTGYHGIHLRIKAVIDENEQITISPSKTSRITEEFIKTRPNEQNFEEQVLQLRRKGGNENEPPINVNIQLAKLTSEYSPEAGNHKHFVFFKISHEGKESFFKVESPQPNT